jgi:hypothetical protein
MPLLYNDIIEIEREVILDHSILLVIHSSSATQGVSKFCFTKCRKKTLFLHKLGYAAVITLLVFVEADGLCNQYFAW